MIDSSGVKTFSKRCGKDFIEINACRHCPQLADGTLVKLSSAFLRNAQLVG